MTCSGLSGLKCDDGQEQVLLGQLQNDLVEI